MTNEIKWDASAPLVVHQHPYFAGVIKMEKVIKDGKEVIEWDQVSPPDAPGRINIDPVTGDAGIGTPYQRDDTNCAYMFTRTDDDTEVMRITKDGIWGNPDLPVDDAAKAVLQALDDQIKAMVQRAVEDEREACAKVCEDDGIWWADKGCLTEAGEAGHLAEAIRARGQQ